jgi:cytochrome c
VADRLPNASDQADRIHELEAEVERLRLVCDSYFDAHTGDLVRKNERLVSQRDRLLEYIKGSDCECPDAPSWVRSDGSPVDCPRCHIVAAVEKEISGE